MPADLLAQRIETRASLAAERAKRLRALASKAAAQLRALGATRVILFGSLASGAQPHAELRAS